ncbi:hypothetical protein HPB49_006934 [Dermacentor silvarum]|uniref:Uncharacterized protein n=1 Tax=Dermacentor silvarum TaxID=543639 RepID=A0ACB8CQ88_DERSI|nr:hypothetical protein HPB49_006934 [Dermacentor silvarum]
MERVEEHADYGGCGSVKLHLRHAGFFSSDQTSDLQDLPECDSEDALERQEVVEQCALKEIHLAFDEYVYIGSDVVTCPENTVESIVAEYNKQSLENMKRAIEDNLVMRSALMVRVDEKFSHGVDPNITQQDFLARLNDRNPSFNLNLEKSKVFKSGGQQFRAPGVNEARGPARRDVRGKVRSIAEPSVDEGFRGTRAPAASVRDAGWPEGRRSLSCRT